MLNFDALKSFFARAPVDIVGIQCSTDGILAARLRKSGELPVIVGASIFSPVTSVLDQTKDSPAAVGPIDLPQKVKGRYAALCATTQVGSAKLLRVPESFDVNNREEVVARMALEGADDMRISTRVLIPGAAKSEARILAAAFPDSIASNLLRLMPAAGTPAARSIELGELAVINAFHNDPRFETMDQGYGLIHFDHDFSVIALFNNGVLSQLRTFPFGVAAVLKKVIQSLNLDQKTAKGVLMDGAFDLSQLIEEGFRDIRSQLVISRDFMERSENCALEQLFISGPASLTKPFMAGMSTTEQLAEWNVLNSFADRGMEELQEEMTAEPWRLTAAIGAALGGLLLP